MKFNQGNTPHRALLVDKPGYAALGLGRAMLTHPVFGGVYEII